MRWILSSALMALLACAPVQAQRTSHSRPSSSQSQAGRTHTNQTQPARQPVASQPVHNPQPFRPQPSGIQPLRVQPTVAQTNRPQTVRPQGISLSSGQTRPQGLTNNRLPLRPATVVAPGGGRVNTSGYATTYGRKLKSGYTVYKGNQHRHWSRRCYIPRWRCWTFYCPCNGMWYYYSDERDLFLPVRYLVTVAPATDDATPSLGEVPLTTQEEEPDNIPEPPQ